MSNEQSELETLRAELVRIRAALATTEDSKRELAEVVHWRESKTDIVTDMLAAIRKRAGLE